MNRRKPGTPALRARQLRLIPIPGPAYAGAVRVLVLVNPVAGRQAAGRGVETRLSLAREMLSSRGVAGEAMATTHAGHAEEMARRAAAEGYDTVFAWGGDGTVNEVARALSFTDTALAVVPAGSGNGLARALHLPLDSRAALACGLDRPARRLDTASLGDRFFLNVAGVGLDAEVAAAFNRPGMARGLLTYVSIGVRAGLTYRARQYTLTVGGDQRHERALIIALANASQYGNGAIVAPDASPDDGLLDLVVIGERGPFGRLRAARRLFNGTLPRAAGVMTRKVEQVIIEADVPLRFHVDGEAAEGGTRLVGLVHAGALKVRA
jgi:YegS/Rv2252/BmrU family lipid kinase